MGRMFCLGPLLVIIFFNNFKIYVSNFYLISDVSIKARLDELKKKDYCDVQVEAEGIFRNITYFAFGCSN